MIIVGTNEEADDTVSVRRHKHGDIGTFPLSEFISKIEQEVKNRELPPNVN